jgi:hypothetical protein
MTFKDCLLWPGCAGAWDWTVYGTHHDPGMQPQDVACMVGNVDVVILSTGRCDKLKICPNTVSRLQAMGITVLVENTNTAIATYKRLVSAGRQRIGAVLHSTC